MRNKQDNWRSRAKTDLKPKEQSKPIENESNNQSKVYNDLTNKIRKIMSKLHDSVDQNNLKFEYVAPTKDVSFYEYRDSTELF